MKKFWTFTGLMAAFVAAIVLMGVNSVFAQDIVNTPVPGTGQGYGQTGVRGEGMGVMAVDETIMHTALADALGMSVDDYEAAIANGETLATLALAQGVGMADLFAVMDAVHADAAQQAVADGLVTQGQAGMQGRRGGQTGQGSQGQVGQGGQGQAGQGGQGQMGQGSTGTGSGQRGASGNAGDCIYPTTP